MFQQDSLLIHAHIKALKQLEENSNAHMPLKPWRNLKDIKQEISLVEDHLTAFLPKWSMKCLPDQWY